MTKLMGFIGLTVASWIGWIVGAPFGMIGSFVVGSVAGGFGMYYGARWARRSFGR